MSDPLIHVENISKKYCRHLKTSLWYGFHDLGREISGRQRQDFDELRPEEFWAVKDVNFSLRRGECLGLLGRNGAGKTTLLRMLNGLIKPDRGRIEIRGRMCAIMALGSGIKNVLTGRENIYSMAMLFGMTRQETDRKIEEIIHFAELEEFIDSPFQNYSSGMRVRLNFATAAVLEPDILLLDEVLAVGDAAFRNKCLQRIATLQRKAAVIFVSHNMEQVARTCSHTLLMAPGQPYTICGVAEGIQAYKNLNRKPGGPTTASTAFVALHAPVTAFNATLSSNTLRSGEPLTISTTLTSERPLHNFLLKFHFYNDQGFFAADGCIKSEEMGIALQEGDNDLSFAISSLPLKNGKFFLSLNMIDQSGDMIVLSDKMHQIVITGAHAGGKADCQLTIRPI